MSFNALSKQYALFAANDMNRFDATLDPSPPPGGPIPIPFPNNGLFYIDEDGAVVTIEASRGPVIVLANASDIDVTIAATSPIHALFFNALHKSSGVALTIDDRSGNIAQSIVHTSGGDDMVDAQLDGAFRIFCGDGDDTATVRTFNLIDAYPVDFHVISGGAGDDHISYTAEWTNPNDSDPGIAHTAIGGGLGNDSIDVSLEGSGDFGNLRVAGGAGNDRVLFNYNYFNNSNAVARADHAEGSISGGAGDDNIALNIIRPQQGRVLTDADFNEAHAVVSGNAGNDSIEVALEGEGNFGNLRIMGNAGNDDIYMHYELEDVLVTGYSVSGSVYGGAGNDRLFVDGGGAPADGAKMVVSGGAGNDLIVNNLATARVYGGSQSDTFVLAEGGNAGTIMDYADGNDHFGLTTGLSFDHLTFYEAGGETFIAETGGAVLATLNGLHADELDGGDFVAITGDMMLV